MNQTKSNRIENTSLLFMIIAPFTIMFYASYVFNPAHAGNPYLYILQVIADLIAITIITTLWITILLDILQPEYHKRSIIYHKDWPGKKKVTVDILIPVVREPLEVIRETVHNAVKIDYPHKVYVLDDGDSEEVKKLAKSLNVEYIARPPHQRTFAKSGNLNYGLVHCRGEFFVIFDADHVPKKTFLTELLPFFEKEEVALVQTPQHYTNTDNFIASGTAQAQEIFYKYVQPAKNSYNASFCVGTNMVYRRSAIDEIGGIALREHSEDIWTSLHLHEKGYESVYYNKVLAEGRAPDNIPSFFRQQNRWALGGFTLFFYRNPLFLDGLTMDQRLQYFFSNIHYFSAFAILIYLFLPIFYLLTGQHSMDVLHDQGWVIHYIPYFATVYFLPLYLLGKLKLSTITSSIASFAPYLQAFGSVFLKKPYKWITTESRRGPDIIMTYIWPHVFVVVMSFIAVVVGWYRPVDIVTTIVTTFWCMINAYFIFSFINNGLFEINKK